jgi:hypothetical protein
MGKEPKEPQEPIEVFEQVLLAVMRNLWNMGGIVALAELETETQNRLAEIAEINGLAVIQHGLEQYLKEVG